MALKEKSGQWKRRDGEDRKSGGLWKEEAGKTAWGAVEEREDREDRKGVLWKRKFREDGKSGRPVEEKGQGRQEEWGAVEETRQGRQMPKELNFVVPVILQTLP